MEYSQEDIIRMIATLQEEQSVKANEAFNLERFKGKPIKSLSAVKNNLKIGSKLWSRDEDRIVTVFEPQYLLTKDERYIKDYNNISDVIKARPDDVIKDITAFGIFSIHITL